MKNIILSVLLLSVCIGGGYFGYPYYQQNFKEWRVSDVQPGYEKVLKPEVHEQIEQVKFQIFRKSFWQSENKNTYEDVTRLPKQKVEVSTNPNPSGEEGVPEFDEHKEAETYSGTLPHDHIKVHDTDILLGADAETAEKVFESWRAAVGPFQSFWDSQPEILQIRENENNYNRVENSTFFTVYGQTPNTPLQCVFMGHDDKKLRTTEVIVFETPPYQEENETGILTKNVKEIKCYPININ